MQTLKKQNAIIEHQASSGARKMSAEMIDTAEETIIDYIMCPHCFDYIQPPSSCCENGHFICSKDRDKVTKCPVCKTQNYPNKNNAVFDMILKDIYYPCVNQENGCPGYFKYGEIQEHIIKCEFQMTPCAFQSAGCPLIFKKNEKVTHEEECEYGVSCRTYLKIKGIVHIECNWRGFREELQDHIVKVHQSMWSPPQLETDVIFAWMLPINMDFEKVDLIQLKDVNEMFYFYNKCIANSMQNIGVQFIGPKEKAAEYMFCVEFKLDSKIVHFQDMVLPYNLSAEDVYRSSNCLQVHYEFLKKHFLAERIIDCYVRIFKKEQLTSQLKRQITFLGNVINGE